MRELLKEGWPHECIYCDDASIAENIGHAELISTKELARISNQKSPHHVLGIFKIPNAAPSLPHEDLVLFLDDIQDPGNLGTIIRSCDWFGIKHIVCSNHSVDCFNPKVVQATMSSIARVKLHYCAKEDFFLFYKDQGYRFIGADMKGQNILDYEKPKKIALIFGNEGNGISQESRAEIEHFISIPKKGKAESLNLSVSLGIILHALSS